MVDLSTQLATLATPIIASTGVIIAAIASSVLTYSTTKKREREAELRKEKLEHYKEFMETLSGAISGERTAENQQAFARACNKLNLVAPLAVIHALNAYQEASDHGQTKEEKAKRETKMSQVFHAMRDDLSVKQSGDDRTFKFRFWAANEASTQDKPSCS